MSVVSVRFDEELRDEIRRLVQTQSKTKSEVVKAALREYLENRKPLKGEKPPATTGSSKKHATIATFQFDAKLRGELERLAKREGKTKTEVITAAVREYATKTLRRPKKTLSAREALKDYIGAWDGPGLLRGNFREEFEEYLLEKRRQGRL